MWSGAITKKLWQKRIQWGRRGGRGGGRGGNEEGGEVEGLLKLKAEPSGNIGEGGDGASETATPLLSANLPHSSIYKHQLPQKSGCLLSINRNHSPMVHLIMRPHTEPSLDAAHHSSGQPAPNSRSRPTPTTAPAHRLQASWGLKEEGAWYEAADPLAPTGLLNEWAARCRWSAWGLSQVYASTKRKYQRPHRERLLLRGQILLPDIKHYTYQFTVA